MLNAQHIKNREVFFFFPIKYYVYVGIFHSYRIEIYIYGAKLNRQIGRNRTERVIEIMERADDRES